MKSACTMHTFFPHPHSSLITQSNFNSAACAWPQAGIFPCRDYGSPFRFYAVFSAWRYATAGALVAVEMPDDGCKIDRLIGPCRRRASPEKYQLARPTWLSLWERSRCPTRPSKRSMQARLQVGGRARSEARLAQPPTRSRQQYPPRFMLK
jgi:hypothetical protein